MVYTYIHADGKETKVKYYRFNNAIDEADRLNAMYRKQFDKGVFNRAVLESKLIQYIKGQKSTFCMY